MPLAVYGGDMDNHSGLTKKSRTPAFSAVEMVTGRVKALPEAMILMLLDVARSGGDEYRDATYRIDRAVFTHYRGEVLPFYGILRELGESGSDLNLDDNTLLDDTFRGVALAVHGRELLETGGISQDDYDLVTTPWRTVAGSVHEHDDSLPTIFTPAARAAYLNARRDISYHREKTLYRLR
jgi:hypothetical protein